MSSSTVRAPRHPGNVTSALRQGRLGTWAVVMFVVAAAAPLTVVAGGATTGFAVTESIGFPVAYIAVGLILVLFSVGYVAMSRRLVNAGAFYSYIAQGLGRAAGVAAAFVAVLAYNAMQIGLYGGAGGVLSSWLDGRFGISVPWWVCALACWALVSVLGIMRIDLNGRVLAVLLLAEVAVVAVFSGVMVAHPAEHLSLTTLSPEFLITPGIGAALVVAVTGFIGFEATTVFSEETKDPRRTVPRATYIAVTTIAVAYGLAAWAMTVATGPANIVTAAQTHSVELIFTLVQPYVSPFLIDLGHVLFVTSLFAALLSFHHTVGRYAFALGREQVLPGVLGRTSRRTGAPKAGSILQSAVALAVLIGYAVSGADPITHLFFWITVLGGFGVLLLMTATSASVIAYFIRVRHPESLWRKLFAPALATILLGWVLVLTLQQFDILLGVPPDSPLRWAFPAAFGVAAILGLIRAGMLKLTRPDVYAAIGLGAHAATDENPFAPPAPATSPAKAEAAQ